MASTTHRQAHRQISVDGNKTSTSTCANSFVRPVEIQEFLPNHWESSVYIFTMVRTEYNGGIVRVQWHELLRIQTNHAAMDVTVEI